MVIKELDLEGKTINNYKILEKLGQGGMASVYKAHELSLNRMVALKVLSTHLTEDKDYIKRFQREAQAAAQLNHPNIVQVYAIGEEKGIYYFAMEYIKGKSLAQLRQEKGVLSPETSVPLISQVAEALSEAHKAGLVHRDIKPSNIMIDASGRPKVTDFGIAFVTHAKTKLTKDGSIIGTPEYLSPEQCEGKTVDQRSDIYSLGVTLYELLSGKTPYIADTPVSMLMKIVKGEFPPLGEVNPSIPKQLQDIVEKMMQKDTNLRYQQMKDVIKDLNMIKIPEKVPTAMLIKEPAANQPIPDQKKKQSGIPAALIVSAVIIILMGGAFAAKVFYFDKKSSESKPTATSVIEEKSSTEQSPNTTDSSTLPESQEISELPLSEEPSAEEPSSNSELSASMDSATSPPPNDSGLSSEESKNSLMANSSSMEVPKPDSKESNTSTTDIQEKKETISETSPSKSIPSNSSNENYKKTQRSSKKIVTPSKPLPPSKSCFISTIGNENEADLVAPYIEEMLSKRQYLLIDGPSVSGKSIASVARNHIVVSVAHTGTTNLDYYGNSSTLTSLRITIKAINPKTGRILAGPMSQTVDFTSLNADEKMRSAVTQLLSKFLPSFEAHIK